MNLKIGDRVSLKSPVKIEGVDAKENLLIVKIRDEEELIYLPFEILGMEVKKEFILPPMDLRSTPDGMYYFHTIEYTNRNDRPIYCQIELSPNFAFTGEYFLYQMMPWRKSVDSTAQVPFATYTAQRKMTEETRFLIENGIIGNVLPQSVIEGEVIYIFVPGRKVTILKQWPPSSKEAARIYKYGDPTGKAHIVFVNKDWYCITAPITNIKTYEH